MSGAGAVHDDDGLVALGERQPDTGQSVAKRNGMGRRPSGGKGRPHVDCGDFGAFGNMAAFG